MNVIITGATKGIGLAIAEKFAAEGFNLALNARNVNDLKSLKKTFTEKFPNIEILVKKTDMSKKAQVQSFAKFVLSNWKSVDILINNAGVFLPGEIAKEADGTLESQINTNLYSAYYLTRAILPTMLKKSRSKKASNKKHIFNMCSIASQIAYPNGVDLPKSRLMLASDIANATWGAWTMSSSAVVEDIVIRPQLGDL